MLKNYIKIAFRTLWRSKAYAVINIIGLAIGITGATLLMTYVRDETSFDKFHAESDNMVRTVLIQHNPDGDRFYGANQPVLAKTLVDEIPEVLKATTLQQTGGHINFDIDGIRFSERSYLIGDESFFDVFDFKLQQGDRTTALSQPNSIVLSEKMAIKFFGKTDVLGEVLKISFFGDYKVTAISENSPSNSHLQFDIIISHVAGNANWDRGQQSWQNFGGSTYFVLLPDTDLTSLAEKVNSLADERMGQGLDAIIDYEFQWIKDIHFDSEKIERGYEAGQGDRSYILIFTSIAIFLLLIAAVNYMNLATSKAVFRSKEIGIRKVVGAVKKQLIGQFLTESILITLLALLISIGLTDITMPFFNELTGKNFDFSWSTLMDYLPLFLVITVSVGALSGVYPSFFMTRFKPVEVLKGEKISGGSFSLRKALVVFQFVMSIVLIITTLIVQDQMSFIKESDLGFNDENLMVIDINNGNVRRNFKAMRSEFSNISGVQSVAVSTRVPGEWKGINEIQVNLLGDDGSVRDSLRSYYMGFDPGMLETFDFRLKDGTYFTGNDQSDSLKILINEAAAEAFGLANPVGSTLKISNRRGPLPVQVVGLLEDFNFKSLHNKIEPIVIGSWNNPSASIDYFILKVAGNTSKIIEQATLVHEKFDQQTAIEYHFLENQLEIFYEKEAEANAIFKVGAGLSIFVACLGLFGLASFTVQKRVKEMGIRKVLGASEWNLFYLLSSSFTKQVIVAFLIASPIAFFIMRDWLQRFVYSVDIGVGVFIIAGIAAIMIALITVSYRSIRAANSNPVGSLRQE